MKIVLLALFLACGSYTFHLQNTENFPDDITIHILKDIKKRKKLLRLSEVNKYFYVLISPQRQPWYKKRQKYFIDKEFYPTAYSINKNLSSESLKGTLMALEKLKNLSKVPIKEISSKEKKEIKEIINQILIFKYSSIFAIKGGHKVVAQLKKTYGIKRSRTSIKKQIVAAIFKDPMNNYLMTLAAMGATIYPIYKLIELKQEANLESLRQQYLNGSLNSYRYLGFIKRCPIPDCAQVCNVNYGDGYIQYGCGGGSTACIYPNPLKQMNQSLEEQISPCQDLSIINTTNYGTREFYIGLKPLPKSKIAIAFPEAINCAENDCEPDCYGMPARQSCSARYSANVSYSYVIFTLVFNSTLLAMTDQNAFLPAKVGYSLYFCFFGLLCVYPIIYAMYECYSVRSK